MFMFLYVRPLKTSGPVSGVTLDKRITFVAFYVYITLYSYTHTYIYIYLIGYSVMLCVLLYPSGMENDRYPSMW